jgi:hypothetical protein
MKKQVVNISELPYSNLHQDIRQRVNGSRNGPNGMVQSHTAQNHQMDTYDKKKKKLTANSKLAKERTSNSSVGIHDPASNEF